MIVDAKKGHLILIKDLSFGNVEAVGKFWIERIQIKML